MELSLDLSLNYVPKTISSLLNEVSRSKDKAEKHAVIDDYLKRLEEEMKKIEAFKRELPLCMLLLSDAIERLKEELRKCNSDTQTQPLMSELFPSMQNFDGDEAAKWTGTCSEKRNWMSSAQLWSPNLDCRGEEEDRSVPQNPIQQHRNRGGAFVPFKANCGSARKDNKEGSPVPSLSLMTPVSDLNSCDSSRNNGTRGSGASIFFPEQMKVQSRTNQQQQQQAFRKQRRCWSSELHRRFVEALQQLGGSHAATPKQIRELMQVDGLTNDEVKSHLQKYRLHVRRLPASSAAAANGVWMPHDHRGDHPKANISQSNSPQGPLPTSGSGKGISSTGDDSLDTEEDERSEVRSWRVGLH